VPRDYLGGYFAQGPKSSWIGDALAMAGRPEAAAIEWRTALRVIEQRLEAKPSDTALLLSKAVLQSKLDDRNAAESLKGATVFVSRSAFPTPDEGEFYWIDLMGLDVVNREGEALGKVVDLMDTGPHSVLRCVHEAPPAEPVERLIPFVAAYIVSVSLADKRIVADWGLDY